MTLSPRSTSVYRRSPNALCRAFGHEVHLIARRDDEVRILTGRAVDIWHLLDGRRDLPEVAEILAQAYGQRPEAITDDVNRFLSELAGLGLVVAVDGR